MYISIAWPFFGLIYSSLKYSETKKTKYARKKYLKSFVDRRCGRRSRRRRHSKRGAAFDLPRTGYREHRLRRNDSKHESCNSRTELID